MLPILLISFDLKRELLANENQHKRENQNRFIAGRGIYRKRVVSLISNIVRVFVPVQLKYP